MHLGSVGICLRRAHTGLRGHVPPLVALCRSQPHKCGRREESWRPPRFPGLVALCCAPAAPSRASPPGGCGSHKPAHSICVSAPYVRVGSFMNTREPASNKARKWFVPKTSRGGHSLCKNDKLERVLLNPSTLGALEMRFNLGKLNSIAT